MEKTIIKKETFPQRLSDLMSEFGETTYSVARKLGMSAATISRYMNGHMLPKLTTVYYLANIYNVNPVWLMGYDVPPSETAAATITEQEKALLAFYRSASEERKQEIIQFVKQKTNGSD